MSDYNALRALLSPLDPETFFADYWEQRSYLAKGPTDRLPFGFTRADFFEAMKGGTSAKVAFKDDSAQHKEAPIAPDQGSKFYDAGLSICAAGLEQGHSGLRTFVDALEDEFESAGGFHLNGYLSPADKGFGIHFDNHSVWIIQVEGAKRWFYADTPEVPSPLTNCVFPLHRRSVPFPWYRVMRPDTSQLNEVLLEPGDVLYLPAGAWHMTEASGGSLSLTLAQQPVYVSQFVGDLLKGAALHSAEGRRALPGLLSGDAQDMTQAELRMALADGLDSMRAILDNVDADALLQAWKQQVEAGKKARRGTSSPLAALVARPTLN